MLTRAQKQKIWKECDDFHALSFMRRMDVAYFFREILEERSYYCGAWVFDLHPFERQGAGSRSDLPNVYNAFTSELYPCVGKNGVNFFDAAEDEELYNLISADAYNGKYFFQPLRCSEAYFKLLEYSRKVKFVRDYLVGAYWLSDFEREDFYLVVNSGTYHIIYLDRLRELSISPIVSITVRDENGTSIYTGNINLDTLAQQYIEEIPSVRSTECPSLNVDVDITPSLVEYEPITD